MRTFGRFLKRLVPAAFLLWILAPAGAWAQTTVAPTVTPTVNTGGWVYTLAVGSTVLGGLVVLLIAVTYMRYSSRFDVPDKDAPAMLRPGVRAPKVAVGAAPARAASAPPAQGQPPFVAPPAAPAPAAPAPATPPTEAPVAQGSGESSAAGPVSAERPADTPPDQTPAATAPAEQAPAPAPAQEHRAGSVELDQETFDRVLAEQLGKGVDRRVAEGAAKRAAVIAARKKAGG
ncbi:MAG: hypothetical protein WD757_05880 [Actinomycetota bacterium]